MLVCVNHMFMMSVLLNRRLIIRLMINMNEITQQPIVILDFGSQYSQLIARRVREMGVYCEIHHHNIDVSQLIELSPCGIILSGGPSTVTEDTNPRAPQWIFESGLPLL